jgi:repressor LexA
MSDNQKGTEIENFAIRVKKVIDSKKMTNYAFEKAIGVTRNSIHNLVDKDGGIGADKIAKIIAKFPDVNPNWLLTGAGEMLNTKEDTQVLIISNKPNVILYNIDASAGGLIAAQNAQGEYLDQWFIPDLIGEHIAISVLGNSMSPTMENGDKIVAKECFRNDLRDGQIYIIISTDNNVRVKRLRMGNEVLMLWSDNVAFQPRHERLDPDDIVKIFHVVMVCKIL